MKRDNALWQSESGDFTSLPTQSENLARQWCANPTKLSGTQQFGVKLRLSRKPSKSALGSTHSNLIILIGRWLKVTGSHGARGFDRPRLRHLFQPFTASGSRATRRDSQFQKVGYLSRHRRPTLSMNQYCLPQDFLCLPQRRGTASTS
jgi:hypothetical protein